MEDPTEDMVRKEIAEAIRIAREDGLHIHKTYSKYVATLKETDPPADPPKEGDPPPKKDPPADPPKKGGLWWGNRE